MIDVNHLCPGCMSPWPDTTAPCPRCGFSWEEQPPLGRALPPFTILAGRYLLGTKLGAGGFGITYLAMDLNEEIPVAIKEFFPSSLAGRKEKQVLPLSGEEGRSFREALRAFRREGELMARFRAVEGIVSWRDFLEENSTAYLVMDYVPGETLMRHMRRTGAVFSQQKALELMAPILRAVDTMHQHHVLHRDISPENLILKPDGTLTLIDFGAAREFDLEVEENLTVILKHGYAPEEQYRSGSHQGPWTDLYACCAVLYQMVSGIRPQDAHQRRENDLLVPLDEIEGVEVTHGFARAVEKGLTVHATERYPSIQALLEDLVPGKLEVPAPSAAKPEAPPPAPPREDISASEAVPEVSPEPEETPSDEPALPPEGSASHPAAAASPAPPPKNKLPRWAVAGAVVLGLGLVIFLGRALHLFGGSSSADPDGLPAIYGNLQEGGTTWVECESKEYRGQADPDTGLIQWEDWSQTDTAWTFSETEIQKTITSSSAEDPDGTEKAFAYDTQGNLLSVYAGSSLLEEYQYDGDTCVATTYDEDGSLLSQTTINYVVSGQYSEAYNISNMHGEYMDSDTGELDYTTDTVYTRLKDGGYQTEVKTQFYADSRKQWLTTRYNSDGLPIETWYEMDEADGNPQSKWHTYCSYDDSGRLISKSQQDIMFGTPMGDVTVDSDLAYSYQLDSQDRILQMTVTTTQDDAVMQTTHTWYTYDEWGNLLAEMEYAEGETEVWLASYTYAQYTQKEGYVFEDTGTVSGSSEPLWSELPEDVLGPSASGADLGLLNLLENNGFEGDSLEDPQYYDSAAKVMTALDAGGIDFVIEEELHNLAGAQEEGYCVIPPASLDGIMEGDGFRAIMTRDMGTCLDITILLLGADYYPAEGFWYGFFSSLLDSDRSTLVYRASDSLHEKLMRPYLDYWSQQTGGTYSLTMAEG